MIRWLGVVTLAACLYAASERSLAHAQELSISYEEPPPSRGPRTDPEATWSDVRGLRSFGWFAAGAITGFLAHEGGHLFANLVLGNVPRFQGIWGFGFIPFFTIAPRIHCEDDVCTKHDGTEFRPGVSGKFAITSAGFNVQHMTDEILLSREPYLRYHVAPFKKGLLAFNILLSVGYATAALTGIENPQGDVTRSAEMIGIRPELYACMLLVPAGLDLVRYFRPGLRWTPWVSRTGKLSVFGLTFVH